MGVPHGSVLCPRGGVGILFLLGTWSGELGQQVLGLGVCQPAWGLRCCSPSSAVGERPSEAQSQPPTPWGGRGMGGERVCECVCTHLQARARWVR